MDALHQIDGWDVPFAAAGVTRADGVVATRGDTGRAVRLASVSKPVAALATLVAAEEGVVDLDEPAGPPGATVRHLLAHASGLPFEGEAPDRARRAGGGSTRTRASACSASTSPAARRDAVRRVRPRRRSSSRSALALDPSGPSRVRGCTGRSTTSSRSAASCSSPGSSRRETHAEMMSVQFPGLDGVLPDFGRFSPLDWGLGVEMKGTKAGHWSGTLTSPRTFGHFGGSGTFLWVDPEPRRRVRGADARETSATGRRRPGRASPTPSFASSTEPSSDHRLEDERRHDRTRLAVRADPASSTAG